MIICRFTQLSNNADLTETAHICAAGDKVFQPTNHPACEQGPAPSGIRWARRSA